jgi:methylglutaconyl-CoA hydratase
VEPTDDPALVSVNVADGVATITLNSPSNRNALSRRLLTDFHTALDRVEQPDVRVVIIDHVGSAFCAGMDMRERTQGDAATNQAISTAFVSILERIESMAPVVIAAVNGAVRAGGVGLMAACDLIVAHSEVTFAFSEVRIGVAPAIISRPVLRRVPWSAIAAPFLTGETFDAPTARAMGLITHVSDDVPAAVTALVDGVLQGAPGAVAATKRVLRAADAVQAYVALQAVSDEMFAGPEGHEGMRSFLERRRPHWVR